MSDRWFLSNDWELLIIPPVIVAILALMFVVKALSDRLGIGPEIQRKIIHIAVGISSLFFPLVFFGPLPVFVLIACAIVVMLVLRQRKLKTDGLGSVLHAVERPSYGEIYLALAVAFLFFRSVDNWVLYVLPLLVITLSDSASALVGTAYGRLHFAVDEGQKSFEGTAIFFGVTLVCAMIVLLLMSETPRPNVVVLSFLIAAFCALVEADSWRGLDNLFVPVGAHLLLERHMETEPVWLLLLAIGFLIAIVAALRYGSRVGLSHQAARAYVIMLFLILSVTHPVNSILPILAILAHLAVRHWNPSRSKRQDLDLLAMATGAALIWLLAGESVELSAINLFNVTFAGVAIVFSVLTVRGAEIDGAWRWAIIPVWLMVVLLSIWIVSNNAAGTVWYDPVWLPIVASLLACLAISWLAADWFSRWRAPKAFAVAMIVPVALFIADGVTS